MRQIFLDTETTGLNAESGDRIIEIGCVELINRRFTGNNLHFYINPERSSHEEALKVHGLTDEFLADKPKFAAIVDELMAYLEGAEILAHNAPFDVGFLDAELKRLGRPPFAEHVREITDTVVLARELYPGKSNSLDALCKRLEVDNSSRTLHGALLDAGLLAEVYIRMTRGQESLVIDEAEVTQTEVAVDAVDFASLSLRVIEASEEERQAHAQLLADLEKATGKLVWKEPSAEAAVA